MRAICITIALLVASAPVWAETDHQNKKHHHHVRHARAVYLSARPATVPVIYTSPVYMQDLNEDEAHYDFILHKPKDSNDGG